MTLDLQTLFAVTALTAMTAGGLLLLSWLYHRHVIALAIWGCGFLFASIGIALIAARGAIPDIWSIMVGNALIALSYGVIWSGVRNFEGRRVPIAAVLAGVALWLLGCQVPAIYDSMTARIVLMSCIIVSYTALNVYELWTVPDPAPNSRWPIVGLLVGHGAIYLLRIPLASSISLPFASDSERPIWLSLMFLEALFTTFCLCYLLASLARERIVLMSRRDARVDPLTGVFNRRGFMERGERLVERANTNGTTVVLLLFDLDHFKTINDSYGHLVGDNALTHFCSIAAEALRPVDLFARLGGEEFGCILYRSSLGTGKQVAERVRTAVEATPFDFEDGRVHMTVSVGVAAAAGDVSLTALMKEADGALYRAKAKGRNRIEPQQISVVREDRARAI
jgi:diguanylate cyclase (GGDEF)-like protein